MYFIAYLLLLSTFLFSAPPKITSTMSMLELNKLTASDGNISDEFGGIVAIFGNTVVVGASGDDDLGGNAGSVYLYEKDVTSGLFVQVAKLTASDGAEKDEFGASVAISDDTIVVGATGDNSYSGSAYLFEKPSNGWTDATEDVKLSASDGETNDFFGSNVAISGNTVVVGARSDDYRVGFAYLYDVGSTYLFERDATSGLFVQVAKLTASDGAAYDNFGSNIAISGNTVVVGVKGNDGLVSNSGSAYLFEKPSTGWENATEDVKLAASDGETNDFFGTTVAISDDTVVVGATGDDDKGLSSGSAYLFEKPSTGWANVTQSAKITAFDGTTGDSFGTSVAISGNTVLVGVKGNDGLVSNSGSAYLFEKPSTGWANVTQGKKLTALDAAAFDNFGESVSISGDTVVVGASWDDDAGTSSGSAYIFKHAITQNTLENKKDIIDIDANDADNDMISFILFGGEDVSLLSIDSTTGLLSFKTAPDFENPQDTDRDNIYEVIIKVKDDSGESNIYAAFIRVSDVAYEGNMPRAMSFKEVSKLTASNGEMSNYFGFSTGIDGTTLVVGAYGYNTYTGIVYIYEYNSSSDLYEEVVQLNALNGTEFDSFGRSVAISGNTLAIGTSSGSAYIFEKPSTGWANAQQDVNLTVLDGSQDDEFGKSVAISGGTLVVGASGDDDLGSNAGSVYLYERDTISGLFVQVAKLTAMDGAEFDYFGRSIAISGDTLVVGATGDDDAGSSSGSAYLFEKGSTGWANVTQSTKLTALDAAELDSFGRSVAISGDTVVVGATGDDDAGLSSGSVYLFEKSPTGWASVTQSAKLTALDGTEFDFFGESVAISGDTVVVGATGNDDAGSRSGSVYLFEKPNSDWVNATEDVKLTASDSVAYDQFGRSVAIYRDTVMVGAHNDDNDKLGDDSGSAYIFKAQPSGINPAILMYLLN